MFFKKASLMHLIFKNMATRGGARGVSSFPSSPSCFRKNGRATSSTTLHLLCMCLFWNKCIQSFVPILLHFLLFFFFKKKEKSESEQLNLREERSKLGMVVVGFNSFGNYLFSSHMKEIEKENSNQLRYIILLKFICLKL